MMPFCDRFLGKSTFDELKWLVASKFACLDFEAYLPFLFLHPDPTCLELIRIRHYITVTLQ